MENFFRSIKEITTDDLLMDFCRKRVLHGTPKIFEGQEDNFYEFRKKIAEKFNVEFHEVFITGSAKLGFSPYKQREFSLDSDIDVAIVSTSLYDLIMESIHFYQMQLRESRKAVSEKEIKQYHKFLEYGAIGWMRPDLLPISFRVESLKNDWFEFFNSISYGRSEIGDYKVSAGVFKSFKHLERYSFSGLQSLKKTLEIKNLNG